MSCKLRHTVLKIRFSVNVWQVQVTDSCQTTIRCGTDRYAIRVIFWIYGATQDSSNLRFGGKVAKFSDPCSFYYLLLLLINFSVKKINFLRHFQNAKPFSCKRCGPRLLTWFILKSDIANFFFNRTVYLLLL